MREAGSSLPERRRGSSPTRGVSEALARYTQICREALEELQRAGEIYSLHRYYGGIASVLVSTGYLHLDSGNIELGASEALKAYELARDKNDHIHMARARTLQCMAENTRVDEQFGEDADAAVHANNARLYAEEAVHWAELTQNRRLGGGGLRGAWHDVCQRLFPGMGRGQAMRRSSHGTARTGGPRSRVGRLDGVEDPYSAGVQHR